MGHVEDGQKNLSSLEESLRKSWSILDAVHETGDEEDDSYDEAMEDLENFGLSVDKSIVYNVWISLGGPNIWLEVRVTEGRDIQSIHYNYNWWSETARIQLYEEENASLWRWVEEYVYLD